MKYYYWPEFETVSSEREMMEQYICELRGSKEGDEAREFSFKDFIQINIIDDDSCIVLDDEKPELKSDFAKVLFKLVINCKVHEEVDLIRKFIETFRSNIALDTRLPIEDEMELVRWCTIIGAAIDNGFERKIRL